MSSLQCLSHDRLLAQLHELIQRDHTLEAELIAHLGEVDARRLYLQNVCPSMFHFCAHRLHFAEGVAYKRIAVARAARKFPDLLAALARGELHLTAASLIAPHLDREGAARWVAAACHKTAQEIKEWIADRKPKDAVTSSVRRAPARCSPGDGEILNFSASRRPEAIVAARKSEAVAFPGGEGAQSPEAPAAPLSSLERGKCEPLGAKRYCIRFEADEDFHQQLQELRALLRHQIPDGDVAKIFARATGVLLEQVRKQKIGACSSPRSCQGSSSFKVPNTPPKTPSRAIPAAIRRAVWARDAGRCTYMSRGGRRCESRDFLEFHHQVPWARNRQHAIPNIHLRGRPHTQRAAEQDFGPQQMAFFRNGGAARPVDKQNPVRNRI
jgi:hypothetical protein